jgi:FkbH-like protein
MDMIDLKYTEILALNKTTQLPALTPDYRIAILSNVTINSITEILSFSCKLNGIQPHIEIGNYDNIVQDCLQYRQHDLVIIFFDTLNIIDSYSGFFEDMDDELFEAFKKKLQTSLQLIFDTLSTSASVIFNSFSDLYYTTNINYSSKVQLLVKALNDYLQQHAPANFTLIDINRIYSQWGIGQCIDQRMYRLSKAPYTFHFLKHYVLEIESLLLRNNGKLKKALIFDCDNTLWVGIVGEDGPEGIDFSPESKTGKPFHDVQAIAVFLAKRGVIIGLCSKNNEADVMEVLSHHPSAVLKDENIVIKKINWNDKASNLQEIAETLNIGLDSMVFVDDNDFEINLVKEKLPEVLTWQVPENTALYPDYLLKNAYKYFNLNSTAEDLQKTALYKADLERIAVKQTFGNIDDYLRSLGIEIRIHKNDQSAIERIAQLTQKTNQFNLTTKRYTVTQIEQYLYDGGNSIFSLSAKDRFGDNGLTAVCIALPAVADEQTVNTMQTDPPLPAQCDPLRILFQKLNNWA